MNDPKPILQIEDSPRDVELTPVSPLDLKFPKGDVEKAECDRHAHRGLVVMPITQALGMFRAKLGKSPLRQSFAIR